MSNQIFNMHTTHYITSETVTFEILNAIITTNKKLTLSGFSQCGNKNRKSAGKHGIQAAFIGVFIPVDKKPCPAPHPASR